MDIVESPRTSFERVEEIVRDDRPQRPRRADTLPVRFDASSSRPSPMFTTRQMPQHRRLFPGAPIPQSRPSVDYYTSHRPVPVNRYQAYYEGEEDNPYNIRNGPTTRHYIGHEPSRDFLRDEPIIISRRMDSENLYISGGREDPYRQPTSPSTITGSCTSREDHHKRTSRGSFPVQIQAP